MFHAHVVLQSMLQRQTAWRKNIYIIQLNAAIQIFSFILSMLIDEYQRSILSQYLFDFSPLTEVKMHFDLATITT